MSAPDSAALIALPGRRSRRWAASTSGGRLAPRYAQVSARARTTRASDTRLATSEANRCAGSTPLRSDSTPT
eukprot:2440258-Rhodomonas_salina.8